MVRTTRCRRPPTRPCRRSDRTHGQHPAVEHSGQYRHRWVWVNANNSFTNDELREQVKAFPDVHVAVGPASTGMEGFRRSHLDALTTQRMLARLHSTQQVAAFEDVELVALLTRDPDAADAFIRRTLGGLASASAELRATVATFIAEQHNASAAAERLYLHRNTLMRRITRAEQLLPTPLRDNGTHIAVALEILHWQYRSLPSPQPLLVNT